MVTRHNNIVNPNSSATYGLVSYGGYGSADKVQVSNVVALGLTPYTPGGGYFVRVLDGNKCFVNVYTDKDCSAMNNYSQSNKTAYNFNDKIDPSILYGATALETLKSNSDEALFDWGTSWYLGNYNDYPTTTPQTLVPDKYSNELDNITFDIQDTQGDDVQYNSDGTMSFGVYQTALSLKSNPYMSFAFAFHGDYKTNRDKIKVRFTYTENGVTVISDEISVPAYTGDEIKNVNGWTNAANNGRYHTFKADMIPVEALVYGIKVEANYNGEGWKNFGTYSASGLGAKFEVLNRTAPCVFYETRVEAVKALLFYVKAIEARYGNQ